MKKTIFKLTGVLLGTLIVVCLCSCGKDTAQYVEEDSSFSQMQESEAEESESETTQVSDIYVYVCGQVKNPGVYVLPAGSRVCDLFELAGGFSEGAATDYWNQARALQDGEMIYVPTIEEAEDRQLEGESKNSGQTDDPNKVNINTASKEELMTLPGIGEAKALAILAYRQEHGSFSSIEEIKKVEGIKEAVFSKMKDFIEI